MIQAMFDRSRMPDFYIYISRKNKLLYIQYSVLPLIFFSLDLQPTRAFLEAKEAPDLTKLKVWRMVGY